MTSIHFSPDPFRDLRKSLQQLCGSPISEDLQKSFQQFLNIALHYDFLIATQVTKQVSDHLSTLLGLSDIRAANRTQRAIATLFASFASMEALPTMDDGRQRRQDENMIGLFGPPNRDFRVPRYKQLRLQMRPPHKPALWEG